MKRFLSLSPWPSPPPPRRPRRHHVKATVNGMVCAFCAQGIEKRLSKMPRPSGLRRPERQGRRRASQGRPGARREGIGPRSPKPATTWSRSRPAPSRWARSRPAQGRRNEPAIGVRRHAAGSGARWRRCSPAAAPWSAARCRRCWWRWARGRRCRRWSPSFPQIVWLASTRRGCSAWPGRCWRQRAPAMARPFGALPGRPALRDACVRTRRVSRHTYFVALGLFGIGAWFAFVQPWWNG